MIFPIVCNKLHDIFAIALQSLITCLMLLKIVVTVYLNSFTESYNAFHLAFLSQMDTPTFQLQQEARYFLPCTRPSMLYEVGIGFFINYVIKFNIVWKQKAIRLNRILLVICDACNCKEKRR